jgi:hypothetical protein
MCTQPITHQDSYHMLCTLDHVQLLVCLLLHVWQLSICYSMLSLLTDV